MHMAKKMVNKVNKKMFEIRAELERAVIIGLWWQLTGNDNSSEYNCHDGRVLQLMNKQKIISDLVR